MNNVVEKIRQFLQNGNYAFTENEKDGKHIFILKDIHDSTFYVNVWKKENGYKLLIEEIYPSCKRSILKSIGDKYCSTHGNYEIGTYDLVGADTIVSEIEKTFKSKEKWCGNFVKI